MKKILVVLFAVVSINVFAKSGPSSLIDLVSFEVLQNNSKVDVKWVTKAEFINSIFVIERSKDGKTFEEVFKMPGNGKGNFYMEYFDADYEPAEGVSYYRLKQVTESSEEIIHSSIAVNFFKPATIINTSDINVTQSPEAKQDFTLLLKGFEGKEVLVVMRDKTGTEYFSKVFLSATPNYIAALDPERVVPSGEYLVTASANNKIYSKKIKVR